MNDKKLTRSATDRWLAGVCGGLGEYFGIDPVVVRVGYIVITVITGVMPLAVAYVLLAIVMPAGIHTLTQTSAPPAVTDLGAPPMPMPPPTAPADPDNGDGAAG